MRWRIGIRGILECFHHLVNGIMLSLSIADFHRKGESGEEERKYSFETMPMFSGAGCATACHF